MESWLEMENNWICMYMAYQSHFYDYVGKAKKHVVLDTHIEDDMTYGLSECQIVDLDWES